VTTVLKIKPKLRFEKECLQLMQEAAVTASSFRGFVSRDIYQSTEGEKTFTNIFTFNTIENLDIWENSKERKTVSDNLDQVVESVLQKKQLTGLEFMFQREIPSPVKWKMVFITVIIIFILIHSFIPFIENLLTLANISSPIKSLIGVATMVSLMTYLIIPIITKVLSRWIFN
jgi:antibiotic biosynthesis monooxygenase (ABM) superfamily enzyme